MSHSADPLPPPVSGTFYDGRGSGRHAGVLRVSEQAWVSIDGVEWVGCDFVELQIPSRVGGSARLIQLPGGAQFETLDNVGVDRLLQHFGRRRWYDPHHFESRFRYVLVSVLGIALAAWLAVVWLIPAASNTIARQLPADFAISLGGDVLTQLDNYYFDRTALPLARRQALAALFRQAVPEQTPFTYQLHFRDGGLIGANALALPNGAIVITDQMVAMADSDEELLSIFYHEVGHVEARHALRRALESTGVALLAIWLTGDLEGAADWVAIIPALLVQSGYSRDHEWEADGYALAHMRAAGVDPVHFANFMQKVACLEFRAGYYRDDPDAPSRDALCPGDLPAQLDALEARLAQAGDGQSAGGVDGEPGPGDDAVEAGQSRAEPEAVDLGGAGDVEDTGADGGKTGDGSDWDVILRNVFATHPATLERIKRFREASVAP